MCNFHVDMWENAYSRYINVFFFNFNNFYLYIKVKIGYALLHVYVWEHRVSLNYNIPWWIFTKLGRDKVFMTPRICIGFWAKSAQWSIQGRAILGQWGALLQRTSSSELQGYSNKQNVIWKHSGRIVVIFGSIPTSGFWHGLVLCIGLNHFHLFSFKYFNGAKCLIYINCVF